MRKKKGKRLSCPLQHYFVPLSPYKFGRRNKKLLGSCSVSDVEWKDSALTYELLENDFMEVEMHEVCVAQTK